MLAAPKFKAVGFLCAVLTAAAMPICDAVAQAFPSRPINIINNYAAGSQLDTILRMMANEAAQTLGQPITLETRAGAGGKLGFLALPKSRGDGHVLTTATSGNVVTLTFLDPDFKIEPGKDYAPVFVAYTGPYVLVANAGVPFRDVKSMLAYAKANPNKLNFGVTSLGGPSHLNVELIKDLTGIQATVVPYKGESELWAALMSGEVQLGFSSGPVKPHVDAGKLVGLATTGTGRWPLFANLPTMQESGFARYNSIFFAGLVAPPDTPADAVNKINAAFRASLRAPAIATRMRESGNNESNATPGEFAAMIRADLDLWRPIVRKIDLKIN